MIIYKLGIENYLIICNASRIDEDINWLSINQKGYDVEADMAEESAKEVKKKIKE